MSVESIESTRIELIKVRQIVGALNLEIGPSLVSYGTADQSPLKSLEWDKAGMARPNIQEERRILALASAWCEISLHNSSMAITWLMSLNPLVGGRTPLRALRDDDFLNFEIAVDSFLEKRLEARKAQGYNN